MKYFLIAGEASGDLHASKLMQAIKNKDANAEFRFVGGDKMIAIGGECIFHYKDIAYMGFIPVMLHANIILNALKKSKTEIINWKPDKVILIDYPGFNLKIASYLHKHSNIPIYYYISPKIWAWKEFRIKNIKRDITKLISILPFEIEFFEKKHNYPIHYVGNPSVDEISEFKSCYKETEELFKERLNLGNEKIIALLPGSRKQEIKDNLTIMLDTTKSFVSKGYQLVIAAAPNIPDEFYKRFIQNNVTIVRNETYPLLTHSKAALITSGTATLETALFGVPQVVCYYIPFGKIINLLRKFFLKVKYISLVNLIVDKELVTELVGDQMNKNRLSKELSNILEGDKRKNEILKGYQEMYQRLGTSGASKRAAEIIIYK